MNDLEIQRLDELLDVEEGLTAWELEFIEKLNKNRERPLSPLQRITLRRVFDERT